MTACQIGSRTRPPFLPGSGPYPPPLPGARSRGRSAAHPRARRGLRRTAPDRARRHALAHDAQQLSVWEAIYQQSRRWLNAGAFEAMVYDLRALLRRDQGRAPNPTAAVLDSRTLRSTSESGGRSVYKGRSAREALSCIWRWTLWAICWHCGSRRPPSRI